MEDSSCYVHQNAKDDFCKGHEKVSTSSEERKRAKLTKSRSCQIPRIISVITGIYIVAFHRFLFIDEVRALDSLFAIDDFVLRRDIHGFDLSLAEAFDGDFLWHV